MFIEELKKNKCLGCWACYSICPVRAIEMKQDIEGFKYPTINYDRCNECGKCLKVCPAINIFNVIKEMEKCVFAAWSIDNNTRYKSTSGGVFSELAKIILYDSGYVCGAVYDNDHMVKHYIGNDSESLDRIRQSKYLQSDIGNIFLEIEDKLKEDIKVIFCGTPCECNGLVNFLKEKEISKKNLIIIDFICRGSNSPKVFGMFLKELEKEYGSKVKRVWFKNKVFGWNKFSTKIDFENGHKYLKDRYNDLFIRGFIEKNLYIRPSCSECINKGENRVSDITLGDFWGVKLKDYNKDVDLGTSAIIINTIKGLKLLERVKKNLFIEEKSIEEVTKSNPHYYYSVESGNDRDKFMKNIDGLNIIENIKSFFD